MKAKVILSVVKNNNHKWVFAIGVVFFFLSNVYFGWNTTAQSGAERVCDNIWQILVFLGAFQWMVHDEIEGFLLKNVKVDVKLEGYNE